MLVQTIDPLGHRTRLVFDDKFNLTQTIRPDGVSYSFGYDEFGNTNRITDPLGQTTEFGYDSLYGNLEWFRDARGNTTRYDYDPNGNLVSITNPADLAETFQIDERGNVTVRTNRRGNPIRYSYNEDGLLTRKDYDDGTFVGYEYDARGNVTKATDTRGGTLIEFDDADRLTKITYPEGRFLEYAYDLAGRRSKMVDQDGFETNYEYDAAGGLLRLTDADAEIIVEYSYDDAGRLSREDKGNATFTTYEYDAAGQILQIVNYNYAIDGRAFSQIDYSYDEVGRRTAMETAQGTWNYGYDLLGQLSRATFISSDARLTNQEYTYKYDSAGNRIRSVRNGTVADYLTNNLNEYVQVGSVVYEYDEDGNLTLMGGSEPMLLVFNDDNMLTTVLSEGQTVEHSYDAFLNRVRTVTNGVETSYLVSPASASDVIAIYDSTGTPVARYFYGIGLAAATSESAQHLYFSFDAIGTTTEITNFAGKVVNEYIHDPFGVKLWQSEQMSNPFQFIGRYGLQEDKSLVFGRARYYEPTIGRFISPDPIGINGGDPNLYRYAVNAPTSLIDVTGFYPLLPRLPGVKEIVLGGCIFVSILCGQGPLPPEVPGTGGAGGQQVEDVVDPNKGRSGKPKAGAGKEQDEDGSMKRSTNGDDDTNPPSPSPFSVDINVAPTCLDTHFSFPDTFTIVLGAKPSGSVSIKLYSTDEDLGEPSEDEVTFTPFDWDEPQKIEVEYEKDSSFSIVTEPAESSDARYDELDPSDVILDPFCGITEFEGSLNVVAPQTTPESGGDGTSENILSTIPEEKAGPKGFDRGGTAVEELKRFVSPDFPFQYRIDFWNDTQGLVPTRDAVIVDSLDPNLDWPTLRFTNVGFLKWNVELPGTGTHVIDERIDLRPDVNLAVNVKAQLDPETGEIRWHFQAVDPLTGDYPDDPLAGFLPPFNLESQYELGWVEFTVEPRDGLQTGTTIENLALVQFDFTGPFNPTPKDENDGPRPWLNTIDAGAPTSSVEALSPGSASPTFDVSWQVADDAGGSGIKSIDIFVSEDDGPFRVWLTSASDMRGTFEGVAGKTYAFYSVARDNVGNVEATPATADTSTTILITSWTNTINALDVNNDGSVSPLDVLQIINELNDPRISLSGSQLPSPASPPPFYDVNGDGFISPLDALVVINFLNNPFGSEGEAVPSQNVVLRSVPRSSDLYRTASSPAESERVTVQQAVPQFAPQDIRLRHAADKKDAERNRFDEELDLLARNPPWNELVDEFFRQS